ncbi:MAG: alpha/beta fold hydrolase [Thermodesulfobacteriota bacterium]
MKKSVLCIVLCLAFLIPSAALAGGSKPACATKYPVILAHGMGVSPVILGLINYWWGIPEALDEEGADVYITSVNGMDSTASKGVAWAKQVRQILAVTGAPKANVIGHSHGCLYTRYAITNCGLGAKIASHTSVGGPHRGSSIANLIVYDLPSPLVSVGADVINFLYAYLLGDTNPDVLQNGYDLCTDYMTGVFNPNTPNINGVYYQSWSGKAVWGCNSVLVTPTWLILLGMEGDNDGLVSVNSAKWGNFRGVMKAAWWSPGVDHLNEVGQFFGFTPGFDAGDFFVDIVSNLKTRGY